MLAWPPPRHFQHHALPANELRMLAMSSNRGAPLVFGEPVRKDQQMDGCVCCKGFCLGTLAAGFLVASAAGVRAFAQAHPGMPLSRFPALQPLDASQVSEASAEEYQPREDWQYWTVCNGARCPPALRYGDAEERDPGQDKFLLLETREAYWNNERTSLEQAYVLAYIWRRTLVLPPLLGAPVRPETLSPPNATLDLEAMNSSVKILSAEDFIAYVKAHPERFPGGQAAASSFGLNTLQDLSQVPYTESKGWFRGIEGVATSILASEWTPGEILLSTRIPGVELTQEYKSFATGARQLPPRGLSPSDWAATALRLQPRSMLGNYYSKVYVEGPEKRHEVREVVRLGIRLHELYFKAAAAAMAAGGIAPGSFAAMHNRQGDWKVGGYSMYLKPEEPGMFIGDPQNLRFLQTHGVIYIASNPTPDQAALLNRIWYPAVREKMAAPKKIVTFEGPVAEAARRVAGHLFLWAAFVEMIICSQGSVFLGTAGSTFTGYVHRLRGYMPKTKDKRILFWERARNKETGAVGFPSWQVASTGSEIELGSEWREGFSDDDDVSVLV